MRLTLFLLLFIFVTDVSVQAQRKDTWPLKGKTVAVYFSKKQFVFDDNYRIPLSQFVLSDQGENITIEDLKIQTLISLGTLFSRQLDSATQANAVYFLNEFPEKARAFMKSYSSDEHSMVPVSEAFRGTDYILVVNPLILGSYKTSAVYTRSNRIITETVINKTARMRIELYDPHTGLLRYIHEACVDEHKTKVPERLFEFHLQHSKTGNFLSKLFSQAVILMNEGEKTNCEPLVEKEP